MAGAPEAHSYLESPIHEYLGIQYLETTPELVTARMKVTDRNRQPDNLLHGGGPADRSQDLQKLFVCWQLREI